MLSHLRLGLKFKFYNFYNSNLGPGRKIKIKELNLNLVIKQICVLKVLVYFSGKMNWRLFFISNIQIPCKKYFILTFLHWSWKARPHYWDYMHPKLPKAWFCLQISLCNNDKQCSSFLYLESNKKSNLNHDKNKDLLIYNYQDFYNILNQNTNLWNRGTT